MNIYYYDLKATPLEQLLSVVKSIKEKTGEEVIALPKNSELLLDCSLDQLYAAKEKIDKAIDQKI